MHLAGVVGDAAGKHDLSRSLSDACTAYHSTANPPFLASMPCMLCLR
jgi:hypothetical protein